MKVVLWDWNGTLLNDAPLAWQAFNDVIRAYGGKELSFPEYQEIYQHPAIKMYQRQGVDLAQHDFDQISDDYHEFYKKRSVAAALHHDSVETLAGFAGHGRRQAILSALAQEFLPQAVAARGIEHFFESIVGPRDRHGHSKVELGHELVRVLGVKGDEVTVVGDSSHDAEVARSLGARCVLVSRGLESPGRLQGNGYPVLESFKGLLELVVGQ